MPRVGGILLVLILGMTSFADQAWAVGEPWGAYGLFPQGSRRVTGMGGAFTGLSDDVNGILFNPAGLAFCSRAIYVSGNINSVRNQETDADRNGANEGVPYTYLQFGAVYHWDRFSVGAGVNSPYALNLNYTLPTGAFQETLGLGLSIVNYDAAFAYRVADQWSVGVTLHLSNLNENYSRTSTNPGLGTVQAQTNLFDVYADFGIIYRPDPNYGLGAALFPGRRFSVDAGLNSLVTPDNWFRDAIIPARLTIGGFERVSPDVLVVLDLDLYAAPGSSYIGNEILSASAPFPKVLLLDVPQILVHGGVEWHALEKPMSDIFLRGGAYGEPPRVSGASFRPHLTSGVEFRYWALVPGVAMDIAYGFLNWTVGIGISMKPFI